MEKNNEIYKRFRTKIESRTENLFDINNYHHTISDWLKIVIECKLLVTDSFHGACFSLIFNKPFIYIENNIRGNSRFDNIDELFNLDKFICKENKTIEDYLNVDYSEINKKLQAERTRCLRLCDKVFIENYSNNVVKKTNKFFAKINFGYIKTYLNYKRVKILAKYGKQKKLKQYINKRDELKNRLDWGLL